MSHTRGPFGPLMKRLHAPIYAARLRELTRCIIPHLRDGDRVLDVGCGVGTLGQSLLDAVPQNLNIRIEGLERFRRGGEPITVHQYDGGRMPFDDEAYDVVIIADVLHHEAEPDHLLAECARVAGRLLIIKDHQLQGPLARARVSLIDWAANAPHGVPCLYRYNTPVQWRDTLARHALKPVELRPSMTLYPPVVNLLFGRRLQFLAITRPSRAIDHRKDAPSPAEQVS